MEKEIKKSPYRFICSYVESIYPKVGEKTFRVLALMPVSLIIPDLDFGARKIRSNINALFLGSAGSGKSSIAKLFSKFVLNPLELESVTTPGLEGAISKSGGIFSLIVGDFARMSKDPILIKVIEGILGEEKTIKRLTARKEIDMDVNGIALLCGVSTDLSKYILSGMLWRVVPILVGHSAEDHSQIGEHIKNQVGISKGNGHEDTIKDYYDGLMKFQADKKNRVVGYNLMKEYREGLYNEWERLTRPYVESKGINFFRELFDGYRFLISHAFLNVYNREVQDGILTPNKEDYIIAMGLMKQSISFKLNLIESESFSKGLKDARDFHRIMQSSKIPEEVKEILRNLVEIKGSRTVKRANN